MLQAEQEELIGRDGQTKDPALAKELIRATYREAYRNGWRPGDPNSAKAVGLTDRLSETYQKIDGRLLNKLAESSELVEIREGVIREIRAGAIRSLS